MANEPDSENEGGWYSEALGPTRGHGVGPLISAAKNPQSRFVFLGIVGILLFLGLGVGFLAFEASQVALELGGWTIAIALAGWALVALIAKGIFTTAMRRRAILRDLHQSEQTGNAQQDSARNRSTAVPE